MSAYVLLNLLNELGKMDKMRSLPSILSLFRNEFNKFNNTRALMLDDIKITLKSYFCRNSQGARFLKNDLAQLASQKRFDFRNS